ncbi:TetR/AcrR family transcriptional regulator [Nocardioides sp. NPDC057772]|uniref:TetR/AcrR family transcriptional regulator n=1 Tax=Nocardioides sp. NPDC057772 TaxID=3346245 RepID=UPI00366F8D93
MRAAIEAVEVFGHDVGLGRIADLAGIARPNLYRLFKNKTQLDVEVARQGAAELAAAVQDPLRHGGSVAEIVHGTLAASVSWAAEHPHLYRFIATHDQRSAEGGSPTGRARFVTDIVDTIELHLRAAQIEAEVPAGPVAAILGLVDGAIQWWLDHDDEPQQVLVDRLADQATALTLDLAARLGLDLPASLRFEPIDTTGD